MFWSSIAIILSIVSTNCVTREKKALSESDRYKLLLMRQYEKYPKKAFPILRCRPDNAITETRKFIEKSGRHFDYVLFDLPGTVNTVGVIHVISEMDYIFVPMRPDRLVMQSTLNFARTILERFVNNPAANTKDLYLFWNMVDRRERPDLCAPYENLLETINLKYFKTRIPVRSPVQQGICRHERRHIPFDHFYARRAVYGRM